MQRRVKNQISDESNRGERPVFGKSNHTGCIQIGEIMCNRSVINGIRVLECGHADYVWDPHFNSFLSVNGCYTEDNRNQNGIRWEVTGHWQDTQHLNGNEEWLKGNG